jgi:hypothetical protein
LRVIGEIIFCKPKKREIINRKVEIVNTEFQIKNRRTNDEMNEPTMEQRTLIAIFCKQKKREQNNRIIE